MSTELAKPIPEAEQLREIVKWVLAGHSESDIVDAIEQKWPKAKTRPLIAKSIERIASASEIDSNLLVGFCFEATRDIYRKCLECGDHQSALRAIKQMHDFSKK